MTMRNYKRLPTIILVVSGALLLGCAAKQGLLREEGKVTVTTNLSSVSQADIDRVRNEAEKALYNICPILGVQNNKSVNIIIVKRGICNAYGGVISLPIWHVRNKKAAIVHEVTHIIASHSYNRFFSEGLAIYFQEKLGEDHGFPNFSGVPLDELARSNKNRLFPINELSNSNAIFRRVGTEERRIAYIETGSFFTFLIETYGEQKVRELHNSLSLDYERVYGKNLRELEKEWRNHLFNRESLIFMILELSSYNNRIQADTKNWYDFILTRNTLGRLFRS